MYIYTVNNILQNAGNRYVIIFTFTYFHIGKPLTFFEIRKTLIYR